MDFREVQVIARGGLGEVAIAEPFSTKLKGHGQYIAIKKLYPKTAESKQLIDAFFQEISLMFYFRDHPNIAKILGYMDKPHTIIMKFYEMGSLQAFLDNWQNVRYKSMALSFAKDIANGIWAFHKKGFCHSDIKTMNVLLDFDHQTRRIVCVLTDFGISKVVNDKSLLVAGFKVSFHPRRFNRRLLA